MEVTNKLKEKLTSNCQPEHMELINESHMHAGPASESHFKLILVSEHFTRAQCGQNATQFIYKLLSEELAGPVHALAPASFLPRWSGRQEMAVPDSPLCAGKKSIDINELD